MKNYFFPDFSVNNCAFGWDYPAWMAINGYERTYLFTDSKDCCARFFPTASDCPIENTQQFDYYWTSYENNINNMDDMPIIYNHTYYPDIQARACVNGTDFPSWMNSDREFSRLYIFKKLEGCCKCFAWFVPGMNISALFSISNHSSLICSSLGNYWFWDLDGCIENVIQGWENYSTIHILFIYLHVWLLLTIWSALSGGILIHPALRIVQATMRMTLVAINLSLQMSHLINTACGILI